MIALTLEQRVIVQHALESEIKKFVRCRQDMEDKNFQGPAKMAGMQIQTRREIIKSLALDDYEPSQIIAAKKVLIGV